MCSADAWLGRNALHALKPKLGRHCARAHTGAKSDFIQKSSVSSDRVISPTGRGLQRLWEEDLHWGKRRKGVS